MELSGRSRHVERHFLPGALEGSPRAGGVKAEVRRARLLCRALRHRRGQHHLLRAAESGCRTDLGRPHPIRVRVLPEAIPEADSCRYTRRAARSTWKPSTNTAGVSNRSRRRQDWGPARAVSSKLQADRRVAGLSRCTAAAVSGLPDCRGTAASQLERRFQLDRCRC